MKPIDWAFLQDGRPIFFVEAKEVGKRLGGYDEQLADYFAKAPEAKLGILTSGVQWRFFTDVTDSNIMDREPFARWDVLNDEHPPYDFLTLLQKSQYNPQLIRTFAERKRAQNLLLFELARLLEPSPEFTRLAIKNIETRMLNDRVLESWKPILVNAIGEWAKQRALTSILENPAGSETQPSIDAATGGRIETTQEELDGLETVRRLLGPTRPVSYEDTVSYFKIHLPERATWVVCRLYFGRKKPTVWVPLPLDLAQGAVSDFPVTTPAVGWSCVILNASSEVEQLGDLLVAAWEHQRALRTRTPEPVETAQTLNQPASGSDADTGSGLELGSA